MSILYSLGTKPLQIWSQSIQNGYIKRLTDLEINSLVLEIIGSNVSTAYISAPDKPNETLGIKLPFLVMVVKNLKKYFTFEVQVIDDKGIKRRFRASNYQTTTKVKPFICTMPMKLDEGWNQIQFNLADFTRRAYGTNYIETLRVTIHANCRLRRVYFSDRLYAEEELPPEFKLFVPLSNTTAKRVNYVPSIKKRTDEKKEPARAEKENVEGQSAMEGESHPHEEEVIATHGDPTGEEKQVIIEETEHDEGSKQLN